MKKDGNIFKYFAGLAIVIGLRFIPHPPNVEPITSTILPFSKKWGKISGFMFGVIAILSFDVVSGNIGIWTVITSLNYGLIGIIGAAYLKNHRNSAKNYIIFSIFATLLYDAITGIGMSTILFRQPLWISFVGQIPFTINHLLGNIFLSALVSPLLYRWIADNPQLETELVKRRLAMVFGLERKIIED